MTYDCMRSIEQWYNKYQALHLYVDIEAIKRDSLNNFSLYSMVYTS